MQEKQGLVDEFSRIILSLCLLSLFDSFNENRLNTQMWINAMYSRSENGKEWFEPSILLSLKCLICPFALLPDESSSRT